MKKTSVTNEQYLPLANKLWDFISSQYEKEPTPEEFAVIIGALKAVEFGITKMLEEK